MKEAQLTLPSVEPPRSITVDGPEIFAALEDIERKGGRVLAMEVGKTPSEWILRLAWDS